MSDLDLRRVAVEEFDDVARFVEHAFGEELSEERLERERRLFEPARSLAAYAGDELVGAAWLLSLQMALPGGVRPVAGVTGVGVSPVYRRRGVLTALMHRQLRDIYERGAEAVAALWASEGAIYGRYGYGLASLRANVAVSRASAVFRRSARSDVRLRLVRPAPDTLSEVWSAVLGSRPGCVARHDPRWDAVLADTPGSRSGAGLLVAVLAESGGPEGYVLYRTKPGWGDTGPDGEVQIRELVATTPRAREALWRHVAQLDLMARTRWWNAPADEPLLHLLANPSGVELRLRDGLFARLVDLPRALSERSYAKPVTATIEVVDDICPWNAGRWHLAADLDGATCSRSDRSPDVSLSAVELAAVHLGGPTLTSLAAAGRVDEHAPGAVVAMSRAFAGDVAPWCPDVF